MPANVPRATYRLQLNAGFTLADAEAVVPYLAGLGISHLYVSSILTARPGSLHGYDVIDHGRVNPELGGRAALDSLHQALQRHDMGLVVDVVPNHMGVGGADNAWWLDVLEWGEESPYAHYFDIDWQPPRRELRGKVLLPFLGDHYGAILEKGELVPKFDPAEGSISVWYWNHRFPIRVADYARLVGGPELQPWRPVEVRRRLAAEIKRRLKTLPPAEVEARLPRDPASLHALLEAQAYRLSYWRVAADEINYRRFFDINDLAALRMVEVPELFEQAHRLIFELVEQGIVSGLRIDHVDGLFDPAEYCRMLRRRAGGRPLWLVVEKILARHEHIRRDWPVDGTTGYDFLNQVQGLFVDPEGEATMSRAYEAFIHRQPNFAGDVWAAKKGIMAESMAAELRVLAGRLGRIASGHWRSRDFTLSLLYSTLVEFVACLPVYRTYVTPRRVTDTDRRYIEWAVARARKLAPGDASAYDFVHKVLLGRAEGYPRRAVVDFAMRLQQLTGPVTAKGVEDTALYRYNRLIALNEVGGDPDRFGLTPAAFHRLMRGRAKAWPAAMLATATHDTKRGEDVRARIAVLSEIPDAWAEHVERWERLNAPFRKVLEGGPAPDPDDEWFLYQTMLGAWPIEADRLVAATLKAAREAKRRTSWGHPDEDYEQAVAEFVRRIVESGRRNPFLDDFLPLQRRCAGAGMVNGLGQTLLKLTCPGVPDVYQGAELWQLALVDPDNRRPVDYDERRRLLGQAEWEDGSIKQALIRIALDLRRRRPELFAAGEYRPLAVRGGPCLAFARLLGEQAVAVAVPLRIARCWPLGQALPPLGEAWRGVQVDLPPGRRWRSLLDGGEIAGERVPAARLFSRLPLALLEAVGEELPARAHVSP